MDLDPNNPVIKLCMEGRQAEFLGQIDRAQSLHQEAWAAAQDDFEASIAAHYVARHQDSHQKRLYWNQVALDKAQAVADQRVADFYPSLLVNMGQSYELLGDSTAARRYYDLAAKMGVFHQDE